MKKRVSSTVTKRKPNPRPRKYASASERQAAYRARAPEVCFRAEPKTVETLDRIAETLDQSRADVLLSMTKFALANHDWARFGLTHKPLPFEYGVNPMKSTITDLLEMWNRPQILRDWSDEDDFVAAFIASPDVDELDESLTEVEAAARAYWRLAVEEARNSKRKTNPMKTTRAKRKPTPAQLAARERFAEMARSGAFKKAGGRKANPAPAGNTWLVHLVGKPQSWYATKGSKSAAVRLANMLNRQEGRIKYEVSEADWSRKTNPAKKTVSQKISQLTREGYPNRQAVAIALNEERAGKVRRNPAPKRERMLNISWLTPGGEREVMSVPIEFTFTEYVGNVAERFFARLENGFLIVSEYSTGGRVGQVPHTMRAAALNDNAAAKQFTREMIQRVGPERFRAAIKKFSKIN